MTMTMKEDDDEGGGREQAMGGIEENGTERNVVMLCSVRTSMEQNITTSCSVPLTLFRTPTSGREPKENSGLNRTKRGSFLSSNVDGRLPGESNNIII